jgi:hypothetical protein
VDGRGCARFCRNTGTPRHRSHLPVAPSGLNRDTVRLETPRSDRGRSGSDCTIAHDTRSRPFVRLATVHVRRSNGARSRTIIARDDVNSSWISGNTART